MAIPEQIGPYTLVRLVGRGGMSTVYEARDTRSGQRVAVKVLQAPDHLPSDEQDALVSRLRREARIIGGLAHPNVVALLDAGEQDGLHYLVMEFLDGTTLRRRLSESGPLSLFEAAEILEQIATGLDAVHAAGILHRDIKPSNIMLLPAVGASASLQVKLLDFGVARPNGDTTLTHAGTLIGTPTYLAPELVQGSSATTASDLWALGAVLYEMLAGRSPFAADTIPTILYRILHEEPPLLPNVPAPVQDVLAWALDKQPDERFASAAALATAFRGALAASAGYSAPASPIRTPEDAEEEATVVAPARLIRTAPPVSAPPPAPVPPAPRRTFGQGLALALAMVVIAVLALASGLLVRSQQQASPRLAQKQPQPSPSATTPKVARATARPKPMPPPPGPRTRTQRTVASAARPTPKPTPKATPSPAVRPSPSPSPSPTPSVETSPTPEATPAPPPVSNGQPEQELRNALSDWIAATNARSIEQQMRFYAPRLEQYYGDRNVSRRAIGMDKRRVFGRARAVEMRTDEPQITLSPDGDTAVMRFRKEYQIAGSRGIRQGAVLQELEWRRTEDGWEIIGERDLRVLRR